MPIPKKALIVALGCIAGAGALGSVVVAQDAPRGAPGMERVQERGGGHGWGRHHRGPGFARFCNDERREAWIEDRVQLIESFAEFTPEQTEAWTGLKDAVNAASAQVGETCEQAREAGRPENTPERLARAEAFMTAGLSVVQEVRPAFETFYASLDDDQKQALDRMVTRHRR